MSDEKIGMFETCGQTLVLGDCMDHIGSMEDASVDVVITSPPYNIGVKYNSFDDHSPREKYLQWIGNFFSEVRRILVPQGSLFLNIGGSCVDPWVPMEVAAEARKHLVLQNRISWVKSITIGDESAGHFKPINSDRFLNNNFEDLFHLTPHGTTPLDRLAIGVPYVHKTNITRWKGGRDIRCAGNVWFIPYETICSREKDRGDHPATFPIELANRCIRLHGVTEGLVVMDPFLGTGSTLIATRRLNLHGIGVEIDEKYLVNAKERIEQDEDLLGQGDR